MAGATDRLGKVSDGTTVMDFDPEEKKRGTTLQSAVASLEWKDVKINLIDTPGLFDFAGGLAEGARAAGCMLIVTDAEKAKYDVGAERHLLPQRHAAFQRYLLSTRQTLKTQTSEIF